MKIKKRQKKVLDRFKCERLSAREENRDLIRSFYTVRPNTLTKYLLGPAWEEDKSGQSAVYIIKSPKKKVAMYFSLKCGGLFRPLDEEAIKDKVQKKERLFRAAATPDDWEQAKEILKDVSDEKELKEFIKDLIEAKQLYADLLEDRAKDENDWINRVHKTFPAVELAQFCVNDEVREEWAALGFTQPLGTVLFWKFVVPRMCKIQKRVGCQYAYLFAADQSEDGRLVNYYDSSLHFKKTDELATTKPSYDFFCEFMCQELEDIKKRRKAFFANFNPDKKDVV